MFNFLSEETARKFLTENYTIKGIQTILDECRENIKGASRETGDSLHSTSCLFVAMAFAEFKKGDDDDVVVSKLSLLYGSIIVASEFEREKQATKN